MEFSNPGIPFDQFFNEEFGLLFPAKLNGRAVALDFPSVEEIKRTGPTGLADAAGNDDPKDLAAEGLMSEDHDPYHTRQDPLDNPYHWFNHGVGQVTSFDAPKFFARKSWRANYRLPLFFEWKADFVEFARLELWDGARAGGVFWFRISDEIKWHHRLKAFRSGSNADWLDAGSHSGLD